MQPPLLISHHTPQRGEPGRFLKGGTWSPSLTRPRPVSVLCLVFHKKETEKRGRGQMQEKKNKRNKKKDGNQVAEGDENGRAGRRDLRPAAGVVETVPFLSY